MTGECKWNEYEWINNGILDVLQFVYVISGNCCEFTCAEKELLSIENAYRCWNISYRSIYIFPQPCPPLQPDAPQNVQEFQTP